VALAEQDSLILICILHEILNYGKNVKSKEPVNNLADS
jgi:hypothetical protein